MKGFRFDLFLVLIGGSIIFASIGYAVPLLLARIANLTLLVIVGRLWYLSLNRQP